MQVRKRRKQNPKRGYGNLMEHVKRGHASYLSEIRENSSLSHSFETLSENTKKIYGWLDWIFKSGLPFSFIDKEETKEYTNLQPICSKTLVNYIETLTKMVEINISKDLPDFFGLINDGWSEMCTSTHYVDVFAIYSNSSTNETLTPLLA